MKKILKKATTLTYPMLFLVSLFLPIHYIFADNYIPLATLEQDKVLEAIWKIEALVPGLFLTGNYMKGPSISDCLEQAEKVSKNILFYMDNLN